MNYPPFQKTRKHLANDQWNELTRKDLTPVQIEVLHAGWIFVGTAVLVLLVAMMLAYFKYCPDLSCL